ncbi:MAG: Mpo1-like protein [Casimicrobiaceae bacterium]
MPTIDQWFDRYGESHRDPLNKALHWICVPAITWSVVAIAWWLSPYAALALCSAALAFYASLSPAIALGMLAFVALMMASLAYLPVNLAWMAAIVFVVAWIGQFAGHAVEGRKPSFVDDLKFLLIGPAWLLGFVYRRLRIRY